MTLTTALKPNAVLHDVLIMKYFSEMHNKACAHGISQNELKAYIRAIADDAVTFTNGYVAEGNK